MKNVVAAVLMTISMVGCSNWNRATPSNMDNTAIEAEVRKNMTADGITGLSVTSDGGVVTLEGHLNATDRAKAVQDAAKVPGVNRVVDHITLN